MGDDQNKPEQEDDQPIRIDLPFDEALDKLLKAKPPAETEDDSQREKGEG